MKQTFSDLIKTLGPNSVVLGTIHTIEVQTYMEMILLGLSIAYTAIRLAMLFRKRNRDQALQDDLDDSGPPDYI